MRLDRLGALALLGGAGAFAIGALFRAPEPTPAAVEVVRATPQVLTSMRQLALLRTSSFHLERVFDLREKISRTNRGGAGPQGPQGPQGPEGTEGAQGGVNPGLLRAHARS